MIDTVTKDYLKKQKEDALALAASSDIVKVHPEPVEFPQHYDVEFHCRGLVRTPSGEMVEANQFAVHIFLGPDILRVAESQHVLTWLGPRNIFHPNIRFPYICVGWLNPGPALVDLIFQVFEMVVFRRVTPQENNCLNPDACGWTRANQALFPTDPRPLKRLTKEGGA